MMKVHIKAASSIKEVQYGPLVSNLKLADFSVSLVTIEVGRLCHFLLSSVSNLCKVCHLQKTVSAIFLDKLQRLQFPAITRFLMPAPPNCGMLLTRFYLFVK